MDAEEQIEEGVPESIRKQLANAVRSIQWSYAVFWSISSTQPGVLEWGDGYYNGDIKTRKTVQAGEFNADLVGLERSEQLRELYESLAATGETNTQARRPSASLSPEDLSDTEWYYLVCMSFVFNLGQGLPGRTLANSHPIWLCNAHYADSKIFSRSLLAKSASIKTVVCFPFLSGVVELGVTDLVLEDPNLIHHIKTSFLEILCPIGSKTLKTYVSVKARNEEDLVCRKPDHDILGTRLDQVVEREERKVCSPNMSSNSFEKPFMIEGSSNVQFMDEEVSNCDYSSMSSGDCSSETFLNPKKNFQILYGEKVSEGSLADLQECDQTKLPSLNRLNDDLHYQSVLSTILRSSHQLILGPRFQNCNKESSFVSWKKGKKGVHTSRVETQQRFLKKVVFEVARMHGGCSVEGREDDSRRERLWRPGVDETENNHHVLSERRRREKINKRFLVLESLVPSISKVDKASILDETIGYLKRLEKRIDELESCREVAETEATRRRKSQDTAERSSDNYGNKRIDKTKKPLLNKRKACDIVESEPEITHVPTKDSSTENITVSVIDKDVLIEIRCPWRECLLLEIFDAITNLQLDSHSVQSSNDNGILSVTIKSKFRESTVASKIMIRKVLQRVIRKC